MKLIAYRDDAGEWRWRIKAANGQVIADSGEGYADRADCLRMAVAVTDDNIPIEIEDDRG